ncbi:hypothetical protein [Algoriphagus sediminis]|uniref:Uncharacterized protein n=1 Tax=Algoriphagus sediminis TaxID=3057113 RepID=A0ABT7YAK1_9BACT|nr:hypothetical protein [Algoriphagus sediminis]MDN3203554.1 hypothetical protein [Algoriphagus sediminis]
MLTSFLLPHRFQIIGWCLLIPTVILLIANGYYDFEIPWLEIQGVREGGFLVDEDENFTNELAILGVFLTLFLIAFSKEKEEDEYIQKLRLESLLIAFYAYSAFLVLGTLIFYGEVYLEFLVLNLFLIQIIFIARFRWVMYKQKKFHLAL